MTDSNAAAWRVFVERSIRRSERHLLRLIMETIGEVLADERDKLRAELAAELERQVTALRDELDAERGVRPLKAAPSSLIA
jgi:hypothetical protein